MQKLQGSVQDLNYLFSSKYINSEVRCEAWKTNRITIHS